MPTWQRAKRGDSATARDKIPLGGSKNPTSFDLSDFFIHCESNGISSAVRLYIINNGDAVIVSHHTVRCVSKYAFAMMICNSFGIDDMHTFGVIFEDIRRITATVIRTVN